MQNAVTNAIPQACTYIQTNPVIWDMQTLQLRLKGREKRICQAIEAFLNQQENWNKIIVSAMENGNSEEITKLSHTIRRTAGNLSCYVLLKVARQIEQATVAGESQDLKKLLPDLLVALQDVSNYFSRYLHLCR